MSRMGGGHRTPSLMGSKQSVYSHTSSAVRTYKSGPKSHKSHKSVSKWYMKPIMKSAIYTDLQRGAWHIAFYTLVSQIVFKEEKKSSNYNSSVLFVFWQLWFHEKKLRKILVHFIAVFIHLDHFHIRIRHLLPTRSQSGHGTYWLLHHQFRLCLCWQCSYSRSAYHV